VRSLAIPVAVELSSPAVLAAAPPASNLIETLPFLPGNTLRGVFARRYLDLGGDPAGEEFRRLFLTGEVSFGPASIGGAEALPLSARSCKYEPGFHREGGHGVRDLLLGAAGEGRCPKPGCGRPLDYFPGFWHPAERRQARPEKRLITRTAIDPERGTALAGQLFSQRALTEGQTFRGRVEAPEDLAAPLDRLLAAPFAAFVGTGASRGQGWVRVLRGEETPRSWGSARERFERFQMAAGRPVLELTLLTEGLFRDDFLRDATAPSLADLEPLGIRPDDWEPRSMQAFVETRRVFGFDGFPLRLPRVPRLAVVAGSVFLFPAKPGREPLVPGGEGVGWIGEGHGEGYGRAVLWHPFHLEPAGEMP
jgi:RAMP superfamily